jgi:hypothetical protein
MRIPIILQKIVKPHLWQAKYICHNTFKLYSVQNQNIVAKRPGRMGIGVKRYGRMGINDKGEWEQEWNDRRPFHDNCDPGIHSGRHICEW